METLSHLRFTDTRDRPILPGGLSLLSLLKGTAESTHRLYHAGDGREEWALKLHEPRRFSQRLAAALGRSPLDREAAMLRRAAVAGLPVARVLGRGVERRGLLVMKTALLLEWCAGRRTLYDAAHDAAIRSDGAALDRAQAVLVGFLAAVRAAGLADCDFGAHNLLIAIDGSPGDAVWIDLEAAFDAAPDDAAATARTAAAALANWWCAVSDQARLAATFAALRTALPAPRGGWSAVLGPLNDVVARRVGKAIRYGWASAPPARLEL